MKPTLLRDYLGQNVQGWLMSEKMDGWRILWDGSDFWTREGNKLDAPEWFKAGLPDFALDGELFAGRGQFNRIQRLIADGWFDLTFEAFDAPEAGGTFSARMKVLNRLISPTGALRIVRHTRCRDTAHLMAFADEIVAAGGEGAVVRNPCAQYEAGRTYDVLRWVPQEPALNRK